MRAISISKYGELLKVKNIPLPNLKPDDLLIKVKYAPINPADIYFSYGVYGIKPALPVTLGMEGSGTVVDSIKYKELIGQRVAFLVKNEAIGSFAEFSISSKYNIIPLRAEDYFENHSCLFVNPFTVLGFNHIVLTEEHKAVIQTASNSALCRMFRKLLKRQGIKSINIVRKEEQINSIKEEGGDFVLNSESTNFDKNLKEAIDETQATCFFDAVGGKLASKIFTLMPKKSVCYSYGALSHGPIGEIEAHNFVFQQKTLKGFWLKNWLKSQKEEVLDTMKKEILENEIFKTKIAKIHKLEKIAVALKEYRNNMSNGKILLDME